MINQNRKLNKNEIKILYKKLLKNEIDISTVPIELLNRIELLSKEELKILKKYENNLINNFNN